MAWTEVGYIDIRLQNGSGATSFYGNGLNQVGVVISIAPTDAGEPVTITQEQLDASITFIDYLTGEPLGLRSGWSVGTTANDYYDGAKVPASSASKPNINGLYQATRYITCSASAAIRARSLALLIKPTDGDAISTAQNGAWPSQVTLTALQPIQYSLNAGNVQVYAEDVPRADATRTQTNFYLAISSTQDNLQHRIFKAHVSAPGNMGPFFVWKSGSPNTKLAWAWPIGPQSSSVADPPVKYNQRPDEVCVSLLLGDDIPFKGQEGVERVNIVIHDQYGNTGRFRAKPAGKSEDPDYGDTITFVDAPA